MFAPAGFCGVGKSRGRTRDYFTDDLGLDTIPQQLVDSLSLEDWLGFVNSIRALDDSLGFTNKFLLCFMFVPFIGTHFIMAPCILCNWEPALVEGRD
jgi:hypothetical protein